MATAAARKRPTVAARRSGYVAAALINGLLLYLVNRRPGWEAVPFLTAETEQVLGLVNASIVAGVAANLVYLVADPPRLRSLGDLVTISIGLAAMVRIWQVFPFSFDPDGFPWDTLCRWVLAVGIVGSAIGIVAALVTLVRGTHR
ncbi:hypothetical protein P0Y31_14105 [Knoellia sp. 3-2P3]|uniref:hypothetical protein n=1 Tax=unclassified Knoellia TaxID=2618719 RepID=UPI0023DAD75E|nr:hypothetical protein [Knoellia sp. 3-2P3]MDF2093481.1 hypothetical protein [Knoellia sp. 3-2P3]